MKALFWTALLSQLALMGCAHTTTHRVQFAEANMVVCKHCNCTMPANLPADAHCAVCECGYSASQCHRGK